MAEQYTLYSMQNSGDCYEPRLLPHLLGLPFRPVDTDSMSGETRTPEFLALDPNGKVPLLLGPYPAIRAWLDRVASRPGHVDIDWRP